MPSTNPVARLVARFRSRATPPTPASFKVGDSGFDQAAFVAFIASQSRPDAGYQALFDFWQIERNRKVAELIDATVSGYRRYSVVEQLEEDGIVCSVQPYRPGTCRHGLPDESAIHCCPMCNWDRDEIPF